MNTAFYRTSIAIAVGILLTNASVWLPDAGADQPKTATQMYDQWRSGQPDSFRDGDVEKRMPSTRRGIDGWQDPVVGPIAGSRQASFSYGLPVSSGSIRASRWRGVLPRDVRRAAILRAYSDYGVQSPSRLFIPGINFGVRSPRADFIPGINYGVRSTDPRLH